jgi:hypothetical protein
VLLISEVDAVDVSSRIVTGDNEDFVCSYCVTTGDFGLVLLFNEKKCGEFSCLLI